MVFWNIKTVSHLLTKPNLVSPTGFPAERMESAEEVQQFLREHFRQHPDVIFNIPLHELTGTVLTVKASKEIVGCIQYKAVGTHEGKLIHSVECFCVHPNWRGKGVGDYLLHELHNMMIDKPYAIFLKEGRPLSIMPAYQSSYVYREVHPMITSNVIQVSIETACKIMEIHQQFCPFFQLHNNTSNQIWKLYKKGINHVLCCVQDTFQQLNGKKMGWVTAWIESPITDAIREEASYQLSSSMYKEYDMIWMDKQHATSDKWTDDGLFYWYTYQWTICTNNTLRKPSYCFIF